MRVDFDFSMTALHNTIQFLRTPVRRGLIPSSGLAKPQVLWIGCSSSALTEMQTLGIESDEVLVHRNIGNLLSNNDLSTLSSVEYALQILKVRCKSHRSYRTLL
jgi:carbonic anhydrase